MNRLLTHLKTFWNSINSNIKLIVFSLMLLLAFFFGYKYHNDYLEGKTEYFIKSYESSNAYMDSLITKIDTIQELNKDRLIVFKTQFRVLAERKKHHKDLAKYFLANYYASILIVMFSSISGGIVIFIIANNGWANTSMNIKALFFVLFFVTAFWGLFPSVFSQKENYEGNLKKYIAYDNLQIEIFNHLASNAKFDINGKDIKNPDSLITSINKRIIDYSEIIITIDASKIQSINDISKALSTSSQSQ